MRSVVALSFGFALSSALAADTAVTFKDGDGTVIWSESIRDGECAFPPPDPVRFGHDFAGWSDGAKYAKSAIPAFVAAGGRVLYADDGPEAVLRGLREIAAAKRGN